MAAEPVIYDISSDEEEFWDESSTPSDWLTKLFTDEHEQIDRSDDVVVVDEILTSQNRNCVPLKLKRRDVDNDDDDCLILDGDPDEQAPTVNGEENGSDDLLIVGEKGQLACRDYPHPRHLCAKFPFSSHSHEKHCNLCHCYVCDIPAPCIYWGTGGSYTDHCHAIDKDENWKVERKSFKQGIMVTTSVQKLLETPSSMSSFRVSSMSSHSSTVSRSFPHRTYHKTCTRTPNTLSHRHNNQQLRSINGTRMLPQYPTGSRSPHVDTGRVNIYKGKSRSTVLAPQFAHANRFKRVGPPGGSLVTASRSGYDLSSNNLSVVTDNDLNLKQWRDLLDCLDTEMDTVQNFSQPGHASNFTNFQPFIASQPQAYAPSSPQLLVNENIYPFENPTIDGIEPGSLAFDHVQSNATPQITSHHPAEDPTFPSGQTATLQAETPANIQPPQSNMLNFGIENWTFPLVDVPMPVGSTRNELLPEMEYVPAQPATPDTGILYEFDNLWGGLARV